MTKSLLILNPHAAGGRAIKTWETIEPLLRQHLPDLTVAITQRIEDVQTNIQSAYENNVEQVIGLGGDGTNHCIINAIINTHQQFPQKDLLIYGTLPAGTGCDWARSQGIPMNITSAVTWLANATPQPTDIGMITIEDHQEYFLNIASAGLSGDVDARVNRVSNRRPWTFFRATVEAMLAYKPRHTQIKIDGEDWFNDKAFMTVVANGTTFGHGMKIAPNANPNDGVFDVVHVEAVSTLTALATFGRVYNGSHLTHPKVHHTQAKIVEILSTQSPIDLDLDGEYTQGEHIRFEIKPALLRLLT